jgi:bla regulator protein BlaR1
MLDELTTGELQLILSHEIAHIHRRDIPMNWVLALVEALHWFNPLVWMVGRELRSAREEACDAYALASHPGANRSYGETVLKILERSSLGPTLRKSTSGAEMMAIVGGVKTTAPRLHQRMLAIARYRPGTRTWIVGACTWLALACIGLTDAEPQSVPENVDTVEANSAS